MRRSSSSSSTTNNSPQPYKKKMSDTCESISSDISDRLRKLSLPNCHLVEAVLKQHSHVFTDDCRDRLRKLLQVIVNVNTGNRKKFERLNEKLNFGSIKNFQQRLNEICTETRANENQDSEIQTELRREIVYSYGPRTSSMICNVSSSVVPDDSSVIEDESLKDTGIKEAMVSSQENMLVAARTANIAVAQTKSAAPAGSLRGQEELLEDNEDFYADKKVFSKDDLSAMYTKSTVTNAYHLEFLNECVRNYTDIPTIAAGDFDSELQVLNKGLAELRDLECGPREFGDFATDVEQQLEQQHSQKQNPKKQPHDEQQQQHQNQREQKQEHSHQSRKKMSSNIQSSKGHSSQIPRSLRVRNASSSNERQRSMLTTTLPDAKQYSQGRRRSLSWQGTAPLSPISEMGGVSQKDVREQGSSKQLLAKVPSLAVRAYITLIMDMQRNCTLYQSFRNDIIKPVEYNKQPYITAAYECWLDYMVYVKNTLDYLHPYIMTLVQAYYTHDASDTELSEFQTMIPKVLINSMKNIKTWHEALHESIDCCRQVCAEDSSRTDVHKLYERYYRKVAGLKSA